MKSRLNWGIAAAIAFWTLVVWAGVAQAQDPLPSWTDGAAKARIVAFVKDVTEPGGKAFVPVPERIAVFDNDGTLWAEQPIYFQAMFIRDRIKALAPKHPAWTTKEPFASFLKGDMKAVMAGGEKALLQLVMATHAGMTSDEFSAIVTDWIATAKHPKTGRLLTDMTYQPMKELLAYLRANGFKTFIVSGGGIEFMRPWAERVYGIPPEQVIGSSNKAKYEMRNGKPAIVRLPELDFIDDKAGKPIRIQQHVGRRPIAAFGNSDGDYEMLDWTTSAPGARLGMLVHHDDAEREYAYDRKSHIGKLDRGLNDAAAKGWTVVSMRKDWKTVFAPGAAAAPVAVAPQAASTGTKVTPENYIRAETDRNFHNIYQLSSGRINQFHHFRTPTPVDKQTVVRMNKDTLYSSAVIDTAGGATITLPQAPAGRYMSILIIDNDHYAPMVIYTPGTHKLPTGTKYVVAAVRTQLFKPDDPAEVALVNKLQDQVVIKAASADPLPSMKWDAASLQALTAKYEKDSAQYPSWKGMMGPRGKVDEKTRHIAVAAAWGLLPEWDATYLNYSGGHDTKVCHKATYPVPANKAFWSITVYGSDGYMKSENSIVNSSNARLNADDTFTVHYGSKAICGDVPNRLDVSEGWNFLMRVYRPGASVVDGTYHVAKAAPVKQ